MKYQVMQIEEDLDFGCEERGADEPVASDAANVHRVVGNELVSALYKLKRRFAFAYARVAR